MVSVLHAKKERSVPLEDIFYSKGRIKIPKKIVERESINQNILDDRKENQSKNKIEKLNSKFKELMKNYYQETNKKTDWGLKITKKFKEWIKDNSSIDKNEKHEMLKYCNYYEKQLPKLKLEELKEYVRQQHPGGECVATEYVNNRTKVPFRCAEGHVWKTIPKRIRKGYWCPKCGIKEGAKKRRKKRIRRKNYEKKLEI